MADSRRYVWRSIRSVSPLHAGPGRQGWARSPASSTAGASLGRDKPKRSLLTSLDILPSQGVEQGTEPLLYAATSPDAATNARLWAEAERLTGVARPALTA